MISKTSLPLLELIVKRKGLSFFYLRSKAKILLSLLHLGGKSLPLFLVVVVVLLLQLPPEELLLPHLLQLSLRRKRKLRKKRNPMMIWGSVFSTKTTTNRALHGDKRFNHENTGGFDGFLRRFPFEFKSV